MRCDVKVRVVLEGAVGDSGIWLQMLDLVEELLLFMLEHASSACERELGVARQETPPIEFQRPLLRLNYLDAWELLQRHLEYRSTEPMGGMTCVLIRYSCWNCELVLTNAGSPWRLCSNTDHRTLARVVKELYHTDVFVLERLPTMCSSLLAMPCAHDPVRATSSMEWLSQRDTDRRIALRTTTGLGQFVRGVCSWSHGHGRRTAHSRSRAPARASPTTRPRRSIKNTRSRRQPSLRCTATRRSNDRSRTSATCNAGPRQHPSRRTTVTPTNPPVIRVYSTVFILSIVGASTPCAGTRRRNAVSRGGSPKGDEQSNASLASSRHVDARRSIDLTLSLSVLSLALPRSLCCTVSGSTTASHVLSQAKVGDLSMAGVLSAQGADTDGGGVPAWLGAAVAHAYDTAPSIHPSINLSRAPWWYFRARTNRTRTYFWFAFVTPVPSASDEQIIGV